RTIFDMFKVVPSLPTPAASSGFDHVAAAGPTWARRVAAGMLPAVMSAISTVRRTGGAHGRPGVLRQADPSAPLAARRPPHRRDRTAARSGNTYGAERQEACRPADWTSGRNGRSTLTPHARPLSHVHESGHDDRPGERNARPACRHCHGSTPTRLSARMPETR